MMMMIFWKFIFDISKNIKTMAGNEDAVLKEALLKANLQALHSNILKENIDFKIAQNHSDGQLSCLGVATIGERHKSRITLRDAVASKHQDKL